MTIAKDISVLVVGHGSTTHAGTRDTLAGHAKVLQSRNSFQDVRYAQLIGGPEPREEFLALGDALRIVVMPMFMSDGYFVRTALPERLGIGQNDTQVHICPPVGLSLDLATHCSVTANRLRISQGWGDGEWDILVAAHGSSKDPSSRQSTERLISRVRPLSSAVDVRAAYIEETPFLNDVSASLRRPTIVIGMFAAPGSHAVEDVPLALKNADQPCIYTGAIGCDPKFADIAQDVLDIEISRLVSAA